MSNILDIVRVAGNGCSVSDDGSGRLVDSSGRYGYSAHLSGVWVCYTCGHVCDCFDFYGEDD